MPPKKKVKKSKPQTKKSRKVLQKQSQKQVVNINFVKAPKKKKRKKAKATQQQTIPQYSTMNLLSSDTARFDTLFNRLYDLQNQKGLAPPPSSSPLIVSTPISTPISTQTDPLPSAVEIINPPIATPIKEPLKAVEEIYNPPLIPSGNVVGDVLDIFRGIFPTSEPPKAKVKKQPVPPNAPVVFDEDDEIPLVINRDKPVVTLLEPDEEPVVTIVSQNNALLDQIRKPTFILQETGDQADLLPRDAGNFDRNVDLQKLKASLKTDIENRAEKSASQYPVIPLIAGDGQQELIPYINMNEMYNVGDELVHSSNTTREPVPNLIRQYDDLAAEDFDADDYMPDPAYRPYEPRADKGIPRGQYKPTKDKIKADQFRDDKLIEGTSLPDGTFQSDRNLLQDIFGSWRETATNSQML